MALENWGRGYTMAPWCEILAVCDLDSLGEGGFALDIPAATSNSLGTLCAGVVLSKS